MRNDHETLFAGGPDARRLHSGMLITKVDGNAADARKRLATASAPGALLQVQSLEGGVTYVLLKAE